MNLIIGGHLIGIPEMIIILFILFLLVVGLIVPVVLTYKFAKKKNRNKTAWLIASILLSWPTFIVIALLPAVTVSGLPEAAD